MTLNIKGIAQTILTVERERERGKGRVRKPQVVTEIMQSLKYN